MQMPWGPGGRMLGQESVEGPLGVLSLRRKARVASGCGLWQECSPWSTSGELATQQTNVPLSAGQLLGDSTPRLCAPEETGSPADTRPSQPGGLSIPRALPEGALVTLAPQTPWVPGRGRAQPGHRHDRVPVCLAHPWQLTLLRTASPTGGSTDSAPSPP